MRNMDVSGPNVGERAPDFTVTDRQGKAVRLSDYLGKTVVLEGMETVDECLVKKIQSFRSQYSGEFYVIFTAPEETLEEIPLSSYDESCTTNNLNTLINRLAE